MIRALARIPTEPVNPGICSFFDIGAAIAAAITDFAAPAVADIGAATAADVGATALGSEAAAGFGAGAGALGADVAGAAGLAAEAGAPFAGAGIADLAGSAGADLGSLFGGAAGAGAGAGTGALDTAGTALAAADPLAAAPAAASSAAIPAAGAATTPLATLDTGAATGILDSATAASSQVAPDISTELFGPNTTILGATSTSGGVTTPIDVAGLNAGAAAGDPLAGAAGGLPAGNVTTAGLSTTPDLAGTAASTTALDNAAATGAAATPTADTSAALDTAAAGKAGGSGLGSTFSTVMGGLKSAAPLVPLAALGTTLIRGEQPLPPQEQQVTAAAGPLLATGEQNLQSAANQQITASQAQQIATWKQQQMNQLYQLYARSGRDPSTDTDYLQSVQQINAQAVSMEQQFIDQLVTTGLGETGQATSALQGAAQMQIQQDQAFQQSLSSAIQAFGLTTALSGLTVNLSPKTT